MTTMYIAYNGTLPAGYRIGDTICSIKAAAVMVETYKPDRLLISLHPKDELTFLWRQFLDRYNAEPIWDDWPIGGQSVTIERLNERQKSGSVNGIRFDIYRELYRRIDGAERQRLFCGRESGLGRRNIFEYFHYGQPDPVSATPVNSDRLDGDLIYGKSAEQCDSVFIAPLEVCRCNATFTFDFWEFLIQRLLAAGVRVALNHQHQVLKGFTHERLTRLPYSPVAELPVIASRHRLVCCGNTGIAWIAAATGTPVVVMDSPSAPMHPDYSFVNCGVQSLAAVVPQPLVCDAETKILNALGSRPTGLAGYEPWLEKYVPQRGTVAIDVGGNQGHWTKFLSQRFERVETYEPNPAAAAMILKCGLANVKVHEVAAWMNKGTLDFAVHSGDDGLSAVSARDVNSHKPVAHRMTVKSVPLDDSHRGPVSFMKIDVEGAEVQVVMGASRLIEQHRPKLIIECHEPEHYAWIASWLHRLAYNVTRVLNPESKPESAPHDCRCWLVAEYYR